ncbi:hypothetical protein EVG20_g6245 [Dentipellis fragilis]|uniref:Uncharacterized protein n=1 Tax=Dentipellis fragilis TaxID=205917 RepID=A0A4Y9YMJ0_9AGAM|nr:hypothetical protein EVG20_g6245 [Dentipellis fragilis]
MDGRYSTVGCPGHRRSVPALLCTDNHNAASHKPSKRSPFLAMAKRPHKTSAFPLSIPALRPYYIDIHNAPFLCCDSYGASNSLAARFLRPDAKRRVRVLTTPITRRNLNGVPPPSAIPLLGSGTPRPKGDNTFTGPFVTKTITGHVNDASGQQTALKTFTVTLPVITDAPVISGVGAVLSITTVTVLPTSSA